MVKVGHSILPKIKSQDSNLYIKILGTQSKSWLERGWYSPSDAGIQWRLYKALYQSDANVLLSRKTKTAYIIASYFFIFAAFVFVSMLFLFLLAVAVMV